MGLYVLNLTLRLYDALFVIYLYESALLTSGAISGICFFGDMFALRYWRWLLYGLGVVIIVIGIVVISNTNADIASKKRKYMNEDTRTVTQTLL